MVVDGDVHADARQAQRDRAADADTGAGDESDLAVSFHETRALG
jgi:hypothetical protein